MQAIEQLVELVHRHPNLYGVDRSRWDLISLRQALPWLHKLSLSAVWQLIKRLGISNKRGRLHVHSPDLEYDAKVQAIERARALALQVPDRVAFLYMDEHTITLRPLVAKSYRGPRERAEKVRQGPSCTLRLAGALDVATGQVIVRRRVAFRVEEMARFFFHLEQHYKWADIIYVVLDNWPIHFHPFVQEYLQRNKSKIRFLRLPTYAPWLNPIEKFWLKLNREFAQHHPYGQSKQDFLNALDLWLDKHREESARLLHEVGLLPDLQWFSD